MPNWVYNTLRVKGTKKRLTQLAWAIGSPSAAIDWTKLATVVPMTWDARDERRTGELEVDGRDLVYRFDTAWNPRPQLIEDLAARYPDLRFELDYVEEGPAFAGAAVYAQGRKVGESYLGDGEEQAFFEPYDEESDDGEWDYDGMTASLLERARGRDDQLGGPAPKCRAGPQGGRTTGGRRGGRAIKPSRCPNSRRPFAEKRSPAPQRDPDSAGKPHRPRPRRHPQGLVER